MPVPIQSNNMQIYKHEYTRIAQITQTCYVMIISNIKISSLWLMFKHKQFDPNYLTNTYFHEIIFQNTVSGIVKPSITIPEKSQLNGSLSEP